MVIALLSSLACSPANEVDDGGANLSPRELLTRASLDFRGIRPSESELEAVDSDAARVDELIDGFMDDPGFPDRIVALYQEIYLSNTEGIDLRASNVPFENPKLFYWEVGQEPIQLVAEVVREDLPYTEIVTADWTMANERTSSWFPMTWNEGDTGWHKVKYTDGRPAAGVIATNGLWWRYVTTEANANRRRANALARILVCEDFLERPIEFDQTTNFFDEEAILDAVHNNPACVNCHVTLDPIASNLFGFYWNNFTSATEGRTYHSGREEQWERLTGTPPGWYGKSLSGLKELGPTIAADPRFPTCAVEQAFQLIFRRDVTTDDAGDLVHLRETFLDSDLRLKALYREIANLDGYRAGRASTDAGAMPAKLMAPDVLASSIKALTGLEWRTTSEALVMYTDMTGVRALAGGVEGVMVRQPAVAPDATVVLVQEAIAAEASAYAIARETEMDASERTLFTAVDFTETPESDEDSLRAQLQILHARVLSQVVALDGPEIDAELGLWSELYAVEGRPELAWQGVLEALFRDPAYLLY